LPPLQTLIAKGESATLELKRSTGELREAMQTLCAFANGKGGRVIIGVKPSGEPVGQQVSEQTLHDIAAARERFEPPIAIDIETIEVATGKSALVVSVAGMKDSVPFTYDGRAFERVGNTTRKLAQERYEALLLERAHSRRRWACRSRSRNPVVYKDDRSKRGSLPPGRVMLA
jgi:ATP-dependent DNA helicase RecG